MRSLKSKNKTAAKNKAKIRSSVQKRTTGGVTKEFMKWLKEFTDEHDDALRELAKR